MNFQTKLNNIFKKNNSLVCIGLDSDFEKIPSFLKTKKYPLFEFNKAIIDKTSDLVCAYKPNSAFYEAEGEMGIRQLKLTCDYIRQRGILVILDIKRADIGNTNEGYAKFAFDYLGADAITIHPYLGREAVGPFLKRKEKGIIILCRTSNPGAGEIQDLKSSDKLLYKIIAEKVVNEWNYNNNCLLVVGATYPDELAQIRKIVGDMNILVPGIGTQGGDLEKTLKAGLTKNKNGLIISSSRAIIFASGGVDFADMARKEATTMKNKINKLAKL